MNTKTHTNKFQESSLLFFQLGLVLALFTVYVALEYKTENVTKTLPKQDGNVGEYRYYQYDVIRIEQKEIVQKKTAVLNKVSLEKVQVVKKKTTKEAKLPFEKSDENTKPTSIDFTKLSNEKEDEGLDNDSHLMINVQEKPIFPGCEKVKELERKKCFEKKITKFVNRKFNLGLSPSLGLSSGKKRILIEFLITKTDEIEITNARAPHESLEKEGKRVVNKLPKMIPGKQNGKEVDVKFILSILFDVN